VQHATQGKALICPADHDDQLPDVNVFSFAHKPSLPDMTGGIV